MKKQTTNFVHKSKVLQKSINESELDSYLMSSNRGKSKPP